jgi:DMSO/TMAO reductase YedYZ molybdopterin-dependent catalytic subunit
MHLRDGASGALAAGLGLGISELVAGLFGRLPSLVEGLGNLVIDDSPEPVKEWAIQTFGTADKLVLLIGIVVTTLVLGALVGVFARRRFGLAIGVFAAFGLAAALATSRDPLVGIGMAIIPAGAAALGGLATLRMLYDAGMPESSTDSSRRSFIIGAGAVLGLAALTAGLGRVLVERAKAAVAGRAEVLLPSPATGLPPVPQTAELGVEGLTPIIVPNDDFYRIDTVISVPTVDLQEWTLTVNGMVERPYTIDFSDLLDMRMVERDVTLSCVSNPVGGGLVGNARWQGVPLREILDRAGVSEGAEQVVGRSVDDFTVGFPLEAAYDGREALVAVGMNGEPLPFEHGFPARLVVAGLYGYVSATKWLTEIELTTWDGFDAYWVPKGWAKEGPIKTQSRIDTPSDDNEVPAGRVTVAGVAWAPIRGISKVELRLGDTSEWVGAELSEPLSASSWVQWRVDWDATPGRHVITCRATDGHGDLQTEERRPPAPDGATGWHQVAVSVMEA